MHSEHKDLQTNPDDLFKYFYDARWTQVKEDKAAAATYRQNKVTLWKWIHAYLAANRTANVAQWLSNDNAASLLFEIGSAYFPADNQRREQEEKGQEFSADGIKFIGKLQQALERAKKNLNPRDISNVGELIATGTIFLLGLHGTSQDLEKASKYFIEAADQGDPTGQCWLGVMYEQGRGVAKNNQEAVNLYRMAADQGNPRGQCNLGVMYEQGRGVAKNNQEAVNLYRMAADQGYSRGQCNLGVMYAKGRGVAQNDQEAVSLFRMAADQGDPRGQCNLGVMYEQGHGVAQNDQEAVRWFRMAADQGYFRGQYNLGLMYEQGHGIAKNNQEAIRLYRMAADQGDSHGQCNLGVMYEKGHGIAQNDQEAVRWFRMAANQGDPRGQRNLGLMYEQGRGVAKNNQEAVRWFTKAAIGYDSKAEEYLNAIKNQFKPADFYLAIIKKDFKKLSSLAKEDSDSAKQFFLTECFAIQQGPSLKNSFLKWIQEDPEAISQHLADQLIFLLYQKNNETEALQNILNNRDWFLQVDPASWDKELLELYYLELYGKFCLFFKENESLDDSFEDAAAGAILKKMEEISKALPAERKKFFRSMMGDILVQILSIGEFGINANVSIDFSWDTINFLLVLYKESNNKTSLFVDLSQNAIKGCLERLFKEGLIVEKNFNQEDKVDIESKEDLNDLPSVRRDHCAGIRSLEMDEASSSGLVDNSFWKKIIKREIPTEFENRSDQNAQNDKIIVNSP